MKNNSINEETIHPKKKYWFLHFIFSWQIPLVLKGWKKNLTENDLPENLDEHDSHSLCNRLEKVWNEEQELRKKPSLARALVKEFGTQFAFFGIMYFLLDLCITICLPLFLKKLFDSYLVRNENTTKESYLYALGIVLIATLRVLTFHTFLLAHASLGMKIRIACCSLLYRKIFKLKKTTIQKFTLGKIINLISNDAERFDNAFTYAQFLWMTPVKLVVSACYADFVFGHTAVAGVAILLLFLVLQVFFFRMISSSRMKVAEKTDCRIRLMSDIISGIQLIKMCTWEKPFEKLVFNARSSEIKEITTANYFRLTNNSFRLYLTKASTFVTILTMALTQLPSISHYIFSLMILYDGLRLSVEILLLTVIYFAEVGVSIRRIQEFLLCENIQTKNIVKEIEPPGEKCEPISINKLEQSSVGIFGKNLSINWDSSNDNYILNDVTFNAYPGELVAIIGAAGSGKSSLLQTILRETEIRTGHISVGGNISYASQEPWIFPSTIKQNIIFGEELDEHKYLRVIKVCSLEEDFARFPFGDGTLVGERGVKLSGGQQSRINLARAVYKDADVYLLDDPLSALDVRVAKYIFENCIKKYLKLKCVILVTHRIQFLHNIAKIYRIEDGRLVTQYSTNTLVESDLSNYVDFVKTSDPSSRIQEEHLVEEEREEDSSGDNKRNAYQSYLKFPTLFVLIFVLLIFAQLLTNSFDYMIKLWVNAERESAFLYLLGGFLLGSMFLSHFAAFAFVRYCKMISKSLHKDLFLKILQSSMYFFNNHSSGRILNRFSKDIGYIDESIPMSLSLTITQMLLMLGTTVIIIILNFWMLIPVVIMYTFFYLLYKVFRFSIKDVRRFEAKRRSPIFTHVIASVQGMSTIKSSNSQKKLEKEFDLHQNYHSSVFYLFKALYYAYAFWIDAACLLCTFSIVLYVLIKGKDIQMEDVGLMIMESNLLICDVQYLMKLFGDLEAQMISVERVSNYKDIILEEDERSTISNTSWPQNGSITFDSVSLRYSPDQAPVLKNVSFHVEAGEKIGIVGRTGSGKSSLISSLFRLFDFEGKIIIDGVDSKSIPLKILRSKISIISQNPILFLGTLRKNLDPFDEFNDSQLWNALEDVQLKDAVSHLPSGLESMVSEGGSNFSVGQKQLLCLARTILRGAKIVVLDEATANVDSNTDELIQTTFRKKFEKCTVLSIAHRLNTISHCDKVLVIDSGVVAEFGTPEELLMNNEGVFYKYFYSSQSGLI